MNDGVDEVLESYFGPWREPSDAEVVAFGAHWCMAPERPPYGADVLCATYEAEGDGRACRVYRCAMPSPAYTLEIDGAPARLSTGIGEGVRALVVAMAEALSTGMLGVETDDG